MYLTLCCCEFRNIMHTVDLSSFKFSESISIDNLTSDGKLMFCHLTIECMLNQKLRDKMISMAIICNHENNILFYIWRNNIIYIWRNNIK